MPDISQNSNTQNAAPKVNNTSVSSQTNIPKQAIQIVKAVPSSPWEEEIDIPETPSKKNPTIIGSLHSKETPNSVKPAPFNVPEKVEEKVGKKVPAAVFIKNPPPANPTISTEPVSTVPSQQLVPQPQSQPVPGPKPAQPIQEVPKTKPEVTTSNLESEEDFDWFGDGKSSEAVSVPSIFPKKEEVKTDLKPAASDIKKPIANTNEIKESHNPATPISSGPESNQEKAISALGQPHGSMPPVAKAVSNETPEANKGIFGKILRKENTDKNLPPESVVTTRSKSPLMSIALSFIAILGIFFIAIALTEYGLLSIGLEKIYGSVGIEKLWGGLPKNSETALGRSALVMVNHSEFKIKGTINFKIDSSVKNEITSPLFSKVINNSKFASDTNISKEGIRVIRTTTPGDYYSTDSSGTSSSSTSSASSSGSSTSTAQSTSSADTQIDQQKTENADVSTIQDVNADVTALASKAGSETTLSITKNSKTNELKLINAGSGLWVSGNADIKYGGNDDPKKFIKYDIPTLKDKNFTADFFNIKTESGFSVKGERIGVEKVEGVNSFKYQIDSMEIGSTLSHLGITSDMVQTASGYIWIGIKDKEIRRISLKLTTPISSPVTLITADLLLYDFDVTNTLSSAESLQSVPSVETAVGDPKRKEDVKKILEALKKYKIDTGSYPLAQELLKLNQSGNIIEKALVPKYLTKLPTDPKDEWYYAYKSDGKKCSISARLESSNDSEGQLINNTLLYLKYNND